MKRFILFFLLLCFFCGVVSSQKLTSVIPPSPKSQNLFRFQKIPVSYNTGVPDISIPIYIIRSGAIEVPITLRYHIRSVRPDPDTDDQIGLGWVLECGGQISREIRNRPDDASPLLERRFPQGDLINLSDTDLSYLGKCISGDLDLEYDIFSYSFGLNSGQFFLEKETQKLYEVHQISRKPLEFSILTTPKANFDWEYITSINVLDKNGFKYKFGTDEAFEKVLPINQLDVVSTWLLKEIKDDSESHNIQFHYANAKTVSSGVSFPGSIAINNEPTGYNFNYPPTSSPPNVPKQIIKGCVQSQNGEVIRYHNRLLKRIDFGDGYVLFKIDTIQNITKGIKVYDSNDKLIKIVDFYQSDFSLMHRRLDSIVFKGKSSNTSQIYRFEYNQGVFNINNYSRYGTDNWGYFNNDYGSSDCTRRKYSYNEGVSSNNVVKTMLKEEYLGEANRTPSLQYSKFQTLSKIIYPTGGSVSFTYGLNKFIGTNGHPEVVGIEKLGGGLRVESITYNDLQGFNLTKEYIYEQGFINHSYKNSLNFRSVSYSTLLGWAPGSASDSYQNRSFANTINPDLGTNEVRYAKVTERISGDNSQGKFIYTYSYDNSSLFTGRSPNAIDPGFIYRRVARDWDNGTLTKKEDYVYIDGAEKLLKKEDMRYSYILDSKLYGNLKANILTKFSYMLPADGSNSFPGSISIYDYYYDGLIQIRNLWRSYVWGNGGAGLIHFRPVDWYRYDLQTGEFCLTEKKVVEYFYNKSFQDSIVTTTNYYYDTPSHMELTRKKNTLSTGEEYLTKHLYAEEKNNLELLTRHRIGEIIETQRYKNGKLLSTNAREYKKFGANYLVNKNLIHKEGSVGEERILYEDYDSYGNVVEVSKSGGSHIYYIWGYSGQYPIAKLENFTSSQAELIEGLISAAVSKSNLDRDRTEGASGSEGALRVALDAIRNHSSIKGKDILVTTYTYDPLIGVTSITDSRGETIYYTYDGLNRLSSRKDSSGHLLEHYEYHYKNE